MTLGRYSITAEFPGFELGLLRDIRINRGDNKHVVVLPLKRTGRVGDRRAGRVRRPRRPGRTRTFGLSAHAASRSTRCRTIRPRCSGRSRKSPVRTPIIRVDSFEGQQLPPKSQIKSIHVTRDQFAAETEQPGSTFVDVITQPGVGPIRGGANFSFRDGSMSAKSQFTPTKGAEQFRGYGGNIGGALVKNKSNFSLSVNGQSNFSTPNLNAATPDGRAGPRR